jgi:hypothetical protein
MSVSIHALSVELLAVGKNNAKKKKSLDKPRCASQINFITGRQGQYCYTLPEDFDVVQLGIRTRSQRRHDIATIWVDNKSL